MRVSLALLVLSLLTIALLTQRLPVAAQTTASGGTVGFLGDDYIQAPAEEGEFTIYVGVEDLVHDGCIPRDIDFDGTPDTCDPSPGLGGFEFTIGYEPGVLVPVWADEGPGVQQAQRNFFCSGQVLEPGSFSFRCVSSGDTPPGPGADPGHPATLTLAEVAFFPASSGSSDLSLRDVSLVGPLGDTVNTTVDNDFIAVLVTGTPAHPPPPPIGGGDGDDGDDPPAPQGGGGAGVPPQVPSEDTGGSGGTAPSGDDDGSAGPRPTAGSGDSVIPGRTPLATATPASQVRSDDDPLEEQEGLQGSEAGNDASSTAGDGGSAGVVLWSLAGAGGLAAAGALGFIALRWRQRYQS